MPFFRDLQHLIEVLFTMWFFLTPVLYPMSLVAQNLPEGLLPLYQAEPYGRYYASCPHCLFRTTTAWNEPGGGRGRSSVPFQPWTLGFSAFSNAGF